jgi:hypothetical protein
MFFFGGALEKNSHFVICLRQLKVFFAIIFEKKIIMKKFVVILDKSQNEIFSFDVNFVM